MVYTNNILRVYFAFLLFIYACGPAEKEDTDRAEFDSTEVSSKRTTDHFESDERGIEDSVIYEFTRKYPEMQYAYLLTDEGRVTTVKGNYQVEIDGVDGPADLEKFARWMEKLYESRERNREAYNEGIDKPAAPSKGYEAYYEILDQNFEYPEGADKNTPEATVFVEFVVDESGNVAQVKAVHHTYYHKNSNVVKAIEKAAEQAIKDTDMKWSPAEKAGKPVKMKLEIPISVTPD
ncbi:energy transducer TonB [Fulvivirga ulvae]|uniref:energy transducer TonB n=1 Tax=Fulvivirga ulvae TaxID=2904245 RepID=UPI001F31D67A|nr:energy transducer TonB [Fulvivirga ulvae]UII33686.1 energy transducer TonB [Fulvivirga ulvae]